MDDALASESFCYLTTKGRRTGRPHEIEIWFVVRDGVIYLLSEPGHRADWIRNLVVDEHVSVRIADLRWEAIASVVGEVEDDGAARKLLATEYQGWKEGTPLSEWARSALLVKVELVG